MAAGSALVHPIRQFLFAAMPAFRAVLAGCFTPGTGAFTFGAIHATESLLLHS